MLKKQIKVLETELEQSGQRIKALQEMQEEFKENFVQINRVMKKANETVNLAADNTVSLAKTQAIIAAEMVRISSSVEDIIDSLSPAGSEIDLRFFGDDDIYH